MDRLEVPASHQAGRRGANRIAVLDGYRALAIISVMFYHYFSSWTLPADPHAHIPVRTALSAFVPFQYGWLGVEFFFVISGFVILMTLERCRNLGDFAVRRFARLWPPLFVAATLTSIAMALIGPPDWQVGRNDYLFSIAIIDPYSWFVQRFLPGTKWVDGAYWSLWVEVRFYVLASLFYLLARRGFIKFWLMFQAAVAAIWMLNLSEGKTAQLLLETFCFPTHMPYFTLGVCLYEIHSDGALRKLAVFGAALAACLILAEAALGLGAYQHMRPLISVGGNLVILALFLLFATGHPLRAFGSRPMVALGQASYSLYLIHMHIGVSFIRAAVLAGVPYLLAVPGTMALVIAAAFGLFHHVEVPAKSWIVRRSASFVAQVEQRLPWLSYRLATAAK